MSFKVGLALGGGGVRGFAHLGILRILEKEGIPIDLIAGTSFGSIVGSTYCIDGNINNCEKKLFEAIKNKDVQELEVFINVAVEDKRVAVEKMANFVKDLCLWNLKVLRRWLVNPRPFKELIFGLVGNYNFSELKIPFVSVAADLATGEEVDLKEGEVFPAVMASVALAGIFPPYKIGNRTLIDGGALSIVPVDAAHLMGADFVIGVNVEGNLLFKEVRNGLDALFQAYEISSYELNRVKLKSCDFVITPPLHDIKWAQFSKASDCVRVGEEVAIKAIPELKKKIKIARRKRRFFSLFEVKEKL